MQVPPSSSPPLRFDGVLVIVGGGQVDADLLRHLHGRGAHLVGADGGADQIAAAGLVPEAIIGDFDSVSARSWPEGTVLRRIAEQDTTDFEKALYSTAAPVTVALGMTGKRLDHTLAALDAITRYAPSRRILLVDEVDVALAVAGSVSFRVKAGARVSVHPLAPVVFERSAGLRYPLDGLRLAPGERTGTSNEAVGGAFAIEVAAGWERSPWLLMVERGYLDELLGAAAD